MLSFLYNKAVHLKIKTWWKKHLQLLKLVTVRRFYLFIHNCLEGETVTFSFPRRHVVPVSSSRFFLFFPTYYLQEVGEGVTPYGCYNLFHKLLKVTINGQKLNWVILLLSNWCIRRTKHFRTCCSRKIANLRMVEVTPRHHTTPVNDLVSPVAPPHAFPSLGFGL